MPDRTINFGESETEATYQIQDTDGAAGGGNFVVAKDTNANTVLLEYQPGSDTWQYAGDVDMNGGNVSGVGTLTADSVNTGSLAIGESLYRINDSEGVVFYEDLSVLMNELQVGDYVFIPSGIYDPITINKEGVTIQGSNKFYVRFNASDGDAITVTESRVTIKDVAVGSAGSNGEHGIVVDGASYTTISSCILLGCDGNHIRLKSSSVFHQIELLSRQSAAGGDSIVFESGASDGIVDQYTNAGVITDNDTSNVVGETT